MLYAVDEWQPGVEAKSFEGSADKLLTTVTDTVATGMGGWAAKIKAKKAAQAAAEAAETAEEVVAPTAPEEEAASAAS